ncbi:hypothetical protein C8J57DRAFT_1355434 [Mycena rebaudengoi]|nr:hypothetical protein C8J57DRAFT_1355434 [Mycena rebaudengoi]
MGIYSVTSMYNSGRESTLRPTSCVFCGFRPHVRLEHTAVIQEFLNTTKDPDGQYRDLFETLGILNDAHFRVLMGLDKPRRDAFFEACVPSQLTHMGFLILTPLLDDFIDGHKAMGLACTLIPRIPDAVESFLAKPETCRDFLAHRMRVSNEEYDELQAEIAQRLPSYMDNPEWIDKLAQVIYEAHPLFMRYADAWPIYTIIKRVLAIDNMKESVGSSKSTTSLKIDPYLSGLDDDESSPVRADSGHIHKCPQKNRYLSRPDSLTAVPAAERILELIQMKQEILPVLWELGIRDDEIFQRVRAWTAYRKQDLLFTSGLKLTQFQKLVVEVVIGK